MVQPILPPDQNATQGAANARNASAAGGGNNFAATMAGLSQTFGPAGYYAAAAYQPGAAPIIGAAVNATAGGAYNTIPGGAAVNPYLNTTVGGSGGSALGIGGVGTGGTGTAIDQATQMLDQSAMTQMAMFGLQNKAQAINTNFTLVSNTLKARDDTSRSMINNMK